MSASVHTFRTRQSSPHLNRGELKVSKNSSRQTAAAAGKLHKQTNSNNPLTTAGPVVSQSVRVDSTQLGSRHITQQPCVSSKLTHNQYHNNVRTSHTARLSRVKPAAVVALTGCRRGLAVNKNIAD